jgi:hypothetical protein
LKMLMSLWLISMRFPDPVRRIRDRRWPFI